MTEATSNDDYQPAEDHPIEDQPVRLRFASPQEQADLASNPGGYQASPGPNEVIRFPGTGLPPDQVKIKSTNIKPYMDNPDLARQTAEVTKARYGGSSIQDSAAAANPPPYGEPKEAATDAYGMPGHNRNRFESEVYKELGGNPFEINAVKQMNEISAKDLPALFSKVFKGQVVWEDRNKLNKNQQAFWQDQVKGYRAHVKESVEAERKTKIDIYNHMMKTFDNDVKEQEAAQKTVREREKEWAALNKDKRIEAKDDLKRLTDLQKNKREILKDQAEIIEKNTDLTTGALTPAAEIRFMELGEQLKFVKAEAEQLLMQRYPEYAAGKAKDVAGNAGEPVKPGAAIVPAPAGGTPKPTAKPAVPARAPAANPIKVPTTAPPTEVDTAVMSDIPGSAPNPEAGPAPADSRLPAAAPAVKPATPGVGTKAKFKPHPKGVPVEVKRNAQGQLIGKFGDGSLAYLEEVM